MNMVAGNSSDKKEVFLRTFSNVNGDADGTIEAAGIAFTRTTAHLIKNDHSKVPELSKSTDAILQAVNDGSSDFMYTMRPCDRSEVMSSFSSSLLPKLHYALKKKYAEEYNRQEDFVRSSDKEQGAVRIGMLDLNINTFKLTWCNVSEATPLKVFLKAYTAAIIGASMNSLWFEVVNGGTLYLSDLGKKTATECGLKDCDQFFVSFGSDALAKERVPLQTLHDDNKAKPQRSIGKKKGKTKSKRKKTFQPVKTEEELEEKKAKQNLCTWMDAIACVHVEAETLFKKKREKLNVMHLEGTAPKERKKASKSTLVPKPINNPPTGGLGGKAGKSHFLIRVGDVENLYKTSKPKNTVHSSKKFPDEMNTIDIHGCTKDEALLKLDERLPKWVDTAMKGEYPWVIPVKIVCGGGSQILSEVVETWIRQNEEVSNAPKNYG